LSYYCSFFVSSTLILFDWSSLYIVDHWLHKHPYLDSHLIINFVYCAHDFHWTCITCRSKINHDCTGLSFSDILVPNWSALNLNQCCDGGSCMNDPQGTNNDNWSNNVQQGIDNDDQSNSINDGLTLTKQKKNNSMTKYLQSIKSI